MFDLEEVFDAFGVEAVAFATDALHFLDLASLARSLDVLEVHVRVLTEVDDASQEVEETLTNENKTLKKLLKTSTINLIVSTNLRSS